jgi:hypothetical protein
MKVKVTDIDWDIGDDTPSLPKEVELDIDPIDVEEFIAEKLSNKYGWCINSCRYEIIN